MLEADAAGAVAGGAANAPGAIAAAKRKAAAAPSAPATQAFWNHLRKEV
jgi:hypothetical protein